MIIDAMATKTILMMIIIKITKIHNDYIYKDKKNE